MELPDDILKLIKEYSMPMTRPDWRKGCYCYRQILYYLKTHKKFKGIIGFKFYIYRKALYIEALSNY